MAQDNSRRSCATCVALEAAGVTTDVKELLPAAAEALEIISPSRGHGDNQQIRRCPTCGTLYRYRYHYEYDVAGSWDEYYLWRLPETAREFLTPLLDPSQSEATRDLAFVPALRHHDEEVRAAAALALWAVVDQGLMLDAAVLPACEALADISLKKTPLNSKIATKLGSAVTPTEIFATTQSLSTFETPAKRTPGRK